MRKNKEFSGRNRKLETRNSNKNQKLTILLPEEILEKLRKESAVQGKSMGYITSDALHAWFYPREEEDHMEVVVKTLMSLNRNISVANNSAKITGEIVISFVKTWLMHNPGLPEAKCKELIPEMLRRYESLLVTVGKSMSSGNSIFDRLAGKPAPEPESAEIPAEIDDTNDYSLDE